jgi:hypothetical protein
MHFRFTAALCAAVLLAVAGSTSAQQATVADTKLLEKAKEIHRVAMHWPDSPPTIG